MDAKPNWMPAKARAVATVETLLVTAAQRAKPPDKWQLRLTSIASSISGIMRLAPVWDARKEVNLLTKLLSVPQKRHDRHRGVLSTA